MPETQATQATQEAASSETAAATTSGFTPPATQAELDRIITDRIARERAKTADYGDLKAKAAKFDELQSASKTETEKLAERVAAAEGLAAQHEARALRLEIAAEKGLTPAQAKRLVGSTREELEADATELLSTFKPAEDATVAAATASLDLGGRGSTATPQGTPAADFEKFISGQIKSGR